MARLLLIRARDGEFETELHEGALAVETIPQRIQLRQVLNRILTSHARQHPWRALKLNQPTPVQAWAQTDVLQAAMSNLLHKLEHRARRRDPFEVLCTYFGDKASIVVLDRSRRGFQDRELELWGLRGASPSRRPRVNSLAAVREQVERMGGEVWSGTRRTGGSALVINFPSPQLKAGVPAPIISVSARRWQREPTPVRGRKGAPASRPAPLPR